ncbi:MAG: PD-(D/E)XK nuclease family protein [Dissulfurimicrobium hydrothermale]|uniref:PD-(D/E)XK nuclease family protein n=1 Tax=Dissulfurimicrobium hydrothermale TaxID=1750598 RepID=UPI003C754DEF
MMQGLKTSKAMTLIRRLAWDLVLRAEEEGVGLSAFTVVFPGKRPAFYLRRELGRLLKRPFVPPQILDIERFMTALAATAPTGVGRREASLVELLYLLFRTAVHTDGRGSAGGFESFSPWGIRLIKAFDEFGAGLVSPEELDRAVPLALADAGLSGEACGLWRGFPNLYRAWIERLAADGLWTRGERYRLAAETARALASGGSYPFPSWMEPGRRRVWLVGFSMLTKAEEEVFSSLSRLDCIREVAEGPEDDLSSHPSLTLHMQPDLHSQIFEARGLFTGLSDQGAIGPDEEAIVLPDQSALIPVLEWLVSARGVPFNISMGYPLAHTPPARLLCLVLDAQTGRRSDAFHVQEYLDVLRHPYVKGLRPLDARDREDLPAEECFRKIVHRIEAWVAEKRPIFVRCGDVLKDLEDDEGVGGVWVRFLSEVHRRLFLDPGEAADVRGFAAALISILDLIVDSSTWQSHSMAGEFMSALYEFLDTLIQGPIAAEPLTANGFRFLFRHLAREIHIPFVGMPLDGLQVLGLMETRCLDFKKVLVFDVNEGILPPEEDINPLLPPGLRRRLGLPGRKETVDLSRRYLQRLLSRAQEAHLFFSEGGERVKSRFIEEILWEKEKAGLIPVGYDVRHDDGVGYRSVCSSGGAGLPSGLFEQCGAAAVSMPKDGVASLLSSFIFSSTSIDTYLFCPFRFYAAYCLGLRQGIADVGRALGPDAVGRLIHRVLKEVYGRWLDKEMVFSGDESAVLAERLDCVLREEFGGNEWLNAAVDLFREAAFYRLGHLLRLEQDWVKGHILLGLERPFEAGFDLDDGVQVRLKGIVDRVERDRSSVLWVIDYKTGGDIKMPKGRYATDFSREALKATIGSFQLPIYLILCDRIFDLKGRWDRMNAAIYELKGIGASTRPDDVRKVLFGTGDDHESLMDSLYLPALKSIVSEILDPETSFEPDPSDPAQCRSCPYSTGLCRAAV